MSDINFNGYSDEEFFKLFLDAVKETYGEYCTFKEREEDLSGYSEPVFEKSIEEAEQRITSIMKIIPKVTNEAAQHKITADYAKRHLEQCEAALSNEQNKREEVEQQLAKANERVKERSEELVNRHNQIQELRQENGEYAILIANLVRRADVKADLLQNPTFEKASEQLNKFAIEKQLETAKKCAFGSTSWVLEHIKFLEEQLRKEQE